MDYVYIAGPLFDDHERSYLEVLPKYLKTEVIRLFYPIGTLV